MAHDAFISHFAKDKATAETGPAAPQVSRSGSQGSVKKHGGRRKWILATLGTVVLVSILLGLDFGWEPAGVRWVDRTSRSGTVNWLQSVFVSSDGRRLWAVGIDGMTVAGSEGMILESADSGKSWVIRRSGSKPALSSICGTSDGKRLLAAGKKGAILESDDGGATWTGRATPTAADLNSIFAAGDGKHLWAAGGQGYDPTGETDTGAIVESDDGGASWTLRNSSAPGILYSIFGSSDGRRLWAVGEVGTMLESVDGGATWMVRRSGASYDTLRSIFGTSDGIHLWAVELHGKILESGDRGATWTERDTGIEAGPAPGVLNAGFASNDGKRIWLLGSGLDASILESDDGGVTWRARYATYMELDSMAGTGDGKRLWIVGQGGTVLESDAGW
jgi:photosystem II stability/assembly factor-like uncharacterized protein